MVKDIREIGYAETDTGLPDRVKQRYDAALKNVGSKLWQGWLKVAASGFGKGMIVTALVALGGMAILGGFVLGGAWNLTATEGIVRGVATATAFLLSPPGYATLAVGGTLGAVSETKKEINRVRAEVADIQATQYELERNMAQRARTMEPAMTPSPAPDCSYCDRELQRRADAPSVKNWMGLS